MQSRFQYVLYVCFFFSREVLAIQSMKFMYMARSSRSRASLWLTSMWRQYLPQKSGKEWPQRHTQTGGAEPGGTVPAPVSFNYLEAFQGRLLQVGLYPWHLTEFVELGLGELTRHMLDLGRGVEVEGKVTHGADEEERGEPRLRVTGACKLGGEGAATLQDRASLYAVLPRPGTVRVDHILGRNLADRSGAGMGGRDRLGTHSFWDG
jgi:hypothetical protein